MQTNGRDFNLNQPHPQGVVRTLEQTADEFTEDASVLQDNWQDANAGKVWEQMAAVLRKAAWDCDKIATKHGFKREELR